MVKAWPNLFIVGVARAGTTSLAYSLGQHPDVFMAPVKEPYFFTRYHPDWVAVPREESAYLKLFHQSGDARYRAEATPAYFWDKESARSIKDASPEARIVISLREPVDRAYSEYSLLRRSTDERRPSFLAVVSEEIQLSDSERGDDPRYNYVARGVYAEGVARYLETFGRERVHVLFFEEFAEDPRAEVRRMYEFLDLDPDWADQITLMVKNRGGVPRNKLAEKILYSPRARMVARWTLPPVARSSVEKALLQRPNSRMDKAAASQMLQEVYAPDWRRLEGLLGRTVPWPRVGVGGDST
jgi:Sulfotransferase domain